MAENCQYCGGRLKRLHPAHEVFCAQRPKTEPNTKEELMDLHMSGRLAELGPMNLPALNRKAVTKNVTTPELVTLKNKVLKLTRAERAKLRRQRDG